MEQLTKEGRMHYTCYLWRGALLSELIYLERLIDDYIARYFCENIDKAKEMMTLILCVGGGPTFDVKQAAFIYLLEDKKHPFYQKHPKIKKDLKFVIEFRNLLAHHLLDSSPEAIEAFNDSNLRFKKFGKKEKDTITVTNKEYTDNVNTIRKYSSAIQFELSAQPS